MFSEKGNRLKSYMIYVPRWYSCYKLMLTNDAISNLSYKAVSNSERAAGSKISTKKDITLVFSDIRRRSLGKRQCLTMVYRSCSCTDLTDKG